MLPNSKKGEKQHQKGVFFSLKVLE